MSEFIKAIQEQWYLTDHQWKVLIGKTDIVNAVFDQRTALEFVLYKMRIVRAGYTLLRRVFVLLLQCGAPPTIWRYCMEESLILCARSAQTVIFLMAFDHLPPNATVFYTLSRIAPRLRDDVMCIFEAYETKKNRECVERRFSDTFNETLLVRNVATRRRQLVDAIWRTANLRQRIGEICIALQAMQLPAFVTLAILKRIDWRYRFLPMHRLWNVIVTVKH